jgi:hypothetical protein
MYVQYGFLYLILTWTKLRGGRKRVEREIFFTNYLFNAYLTRRIDEAL